MKFLRLGLNCSMIVWKRGQHTLAEVSGAGGSSGLTLNGQLCAHEGRDRAKPPGAQHKPPDTPSTLVAHKAFGTTTSWQHCSKPAALMAQKGKWGNLG